MSSSGQEHGPLLNRRQYILTNCRTETDVRTDDLACGIQYYYHYYYFIIIIITGFIGLFRRLKVLYNLKKNMQLANTHIQINGK